MTCAKLGEAEVLAEHGFTDLLIANQVVGRRKLDRLVQVARRADLKVAVDALGQADAISRAAAAAGVEIGVLIEVDIGMGRCGVPAGQPVLDLARGIGRLPGLRLDGIQAFEGHAVYIDDPQQRDQTVRKSFEPAIESRRLLERNGIRVRILSGGSSSTYQITGTIDGVDELQAGSYATMDWRYARMLPEYEVALSVLTRVISHRGDTAVLDVGLKGAGNEFGLPRIKDEPDAEIPSFVSEEHCIVRNVPGWTVGQAVQLLPSHACTTCNLYRKLYVHEAGRIVDVWPIEAAGKLT
jgi:3-hydroxy-D-aspartate aldolase